MQPAGTQGLPSYTSATGCLQTWHQPRKRSSTSCTLDNIKFNKAVYGKQSTKMASTNYDPRPSHLQHTSTEAILQLRRDLEALETPVAFLHVLPYRRDTVIDHTAGSLLPLIPKAAQFRIQTAIKAEAHTLSLSVLHQRMINFMKMITHSKEDCARIEVATRLQSKCVHWFEERHCQYSYSNFSNMRKSVTTSKIKSLLYSLDKSSVTSSAILWGKLHEKSAFHQY